MPADYEFLHEYGERYPLLWEAPDHIKRLLRRQGRKAWGDMVDFDKALEQIQLMANVDTAFGQNLFAVVLNGTHLFVFSVSNPWYAPLERWLVEQFFLRIAPGDAGGAYEAIELVAKDFQASRIIMATAFAANDAALGKVYQAHGYTQQSTQYVKEASWLQSAPSLGHSPP